MHGFLEHLLNTIYKEISEGNDPAATKGVNATTVNQGLTMLGEGKIEEIRVELSLGPICSFKNQKV